MANIISDTFIKKFIMEHKSMMTLYVIVIMFTWPTEAILLSRQYSGLITSLRKKASFKDMFRFSENIRSGNIFGMLTLVFLIWCGLLIFYGIKHSMEEKIFPLYMSFVRETLISGILHSNSSNYQDIKSGEYLAIINELTHVFLGLTQMVANKFLPLFIGLIAISIYYMVIHPIIGGTFLVISIIRIIINYLQGFDYAKSCAVRDESYFKLNEHMSDTFNNSMNIHLNNTLKHEEKKVRKMNKEYDAEQEEEMRIRKNIVWKSNFLSILCFILMIVLSFYLYSKKKLSLTLLITIAFIEIKLVGTFIEFDSTSLVFFQRLGTVIATEEFLQKILKSSDESSKKCGPKNGSVRIKNMHFQYDPKSPEVFRNMNLDIKSGDRVGLIGRSGSGKTSLMKILLGLHNVQKGTIEIGGCNIQKIKAEKLRNDLIYVNQRTQLFNMSVLKNIQYGNPGLSEKEIVAYMKKYSLDEIYNKLDNGIKSMAGTNGSLMSLGMQKVTMILRGVFKHGLVYIFDEPLSGLDVKTRVKVIRMIDDIPKSKTVVVITHDNEILSHLDKVYKLDELHGKKR